MVKGAVGVVGEGTGMSSKEPLEALVAALVSDESLVSLLTSCASGSVVCNGVAMVSSEKSLGRSVSIEGAAGEDVDEAE